MTTAPLLLFSLPGNEEMTARLANHLACDVGVLETRNFPDGETYLKLATPVEGRAIGFVCTLNHPNDKILPLLFAAATARDFKAAKIGLVAPYLAYMRQDKRFHDGEAVTSRPFAQLLSGAFDWLVTVDPHLHRYKSLADIYSIPTCNVHAAPLLAQWIKNNVPEPLIIGPDVESEQWVSAVARQVGAPFTVLDKVRRGDRDVEVSLRQLDRLEGRIPVLVDDIISSGVTMREAGTPPSRQDSCSSNLFGRTRDFRGWIGPLARSGRRESRYVQHSAA